MTLSITAPTRATAVVLSIPHQLPRLLSQRHHILRANAFRQINLYSTQPTTTTPTPPTEPSKPEDETINGPLSTLPPPLDLPERGDKAAVQHLFQIGRAYGKFYWAGVKATWSNHKQAKVLKDSIRQRNREMGLPKMPRPLLAHCEFYFSSGGRLTRSQFQLLTREQYDFRKLPPFALMVALFGEWLPFIVPFFPSAVPRTCRIPKQVEDMRKGVEERRKLSFREGLEIPDVPEMNDETAPAGLANNKAPLPKLFRSMQLSQHIVNKGKPQALHISRTLGLGGRLFDKMGVLHPLFPVKLMRHLAYLHFDDAFLLQDWVLSHLVLSEEETRIACEERGIDVVGRSESDLKVDLGKWLEGRRRDDGSYKEIVRMLFTRPNTWG